MVSITLSVPEELKHEMDEFSEINWSAVARQAIMAKIIVFKKMNELFSKSELTESEALLLGKKISKKAMERLKA